MKTKNGELVNLASLYNFSPLLVFRQPRLKLNPREQILAQISLSRRQQQQLEHATPFLFLSRQDETNRNLIISLKRVVCRRNRYILTGQNNFSFTNWNI